MKPTILFSICAFILGGCSQSEPARIRDISNTPAQLGENLATKGAEDRYVYVAPEIKEIKQTNQIVHASKTSTVVENGKTITTASNTITYNRNYDSIPKGGYKGDKYKVKHGDTLYYIAWITGNDTRALAAKNNLVPPYDLDVGRVLDVSGSTTVETKTVTITNKSGAQKTESQVRQVVQKPAISTKTTTTMVTQTPTKTVANGDIKWVWPAKGKVTKSVNGIDIAGKLGDPVLAAANGRVVYVGNDVAGYGNLIIIKHKDDYLTAYGHNQAFLVKEGQEVKAGQQIATMGSTGTNAVKSHVEVRYKTESVDPLKYFPKS